MLIVHTSIGTELRFGFFFFPYQLGPGNYLNVQPDMSSDSSNRGCRWGRNQSVHVLRTLRLVTEPTSLLCNPFAQHDHRQPYRARRRYLAAAENVGWTRGTRQRRLVLVRRLPVF